MQAFKYRAKLLCMSSTVTEPATYQQPSIEVLWKGKASCLMTMMIHTYALPIYQAQVCAMQVYI